jgi:hypothetical protein
MLTVNTDCLTRDPDAGLCQEGHPRRRIGEDMMHTPHEQGNLVEDVVRIFDRLSEEDPGGAAGGFGSDRELAIGDLKDLSREELLGDIEQAARFLSATWTLAAELDSSMAMIAITDAKHRVEDAYERVRRGGDA